MLTKFAVTNYCGFHQRIEFDLSSPSNYNFNLGAITNGVIKNGIIYGPNGSGKTNLGLAIFDIVHHLSDKEKKPDYYKNFIYAGDPNGVVKFEYTFLFDKDRVLYTYETNNVGRIINETLHANGKLIFDRQSTSLTINPKYFKVVQSINTMLANSANNVSIVRFLSSSFPLSADHFLVKLCRFVDGMLWFRRLDSPQYIGFENGSVILDEYIITHDLVSDFAEFLEAVSGQKYSFKQPAEGEKVLFCLINEQEVPFNDIASTGTLALRLMYYWLKRMVDASFVFIDEFDAFYHHELSMNVCKQLFKLPCQIFTTTHNTHLMTNDLLRPDCYFLIDDCKILPLSKCTEKELREAHNIEKIYKAGGFYVG